MRKKIAIKNDSLIILKWTFFCSSFQNFFRIFSSTHQYFFWQITAHYEQKNGKNDCKIIWINRISTFFTKSSFMNPHWLHRFKTMNHQFKSTIRQKGFWNSDEKHWKSTNTWSHFLFEINFKIHHHFFLN